MKRIAYPDTAHARITEATAESGTILRIVWENGHTSRIDLAPWIDAHADLAGLRSRGAFARVQVVEFGGFVHWGEDGEEEPAIDGLHLWLMEQGQRGVPLTPDALRRWRESRGLTLDQAADATGVSRRQWAYYEAGQTVIPYGLGLACKGYDALRKEAA